MDQLELLEEKRVALNSLIEQVAHEAKLLLYFYFWLGSLKYVVINEMCVKEALVFMGLFNGKCNRIVLYCVLIEPQEILLSS